MASTSNEWCWVLSATSAETPAQHGVEKCLQGWGTMENKQRNWPIERQPFPIIGPARSFGETRPCDKDCTLGLWKNGT